MGLCYEMPHSEAWTTFFPVSKPINTISQPFKLDTASGVGAGGLLQEAGRILTGKMSSSCVCRVRKCGCEDGGWMV